MVDVVSHASGVFVVEVVDMAGSSWLRVGRALQERYVLALDHGPFFRVVYTVGPAVGAKAAEFAFEGLVGFGVYESPCSDDT